MIRVYLKHAAPVDFPTGADIEPTLFPAPVGAGGRHAIEVVDADGNAVACFQIAEVAGYAIDPPESFRRPRASRHAPPVPITGTGGALARRSGA